jgi:predicted Zn-ribbon and HTH transcriptional regulator
LSLQGGQLDYAFRAGAVRRARALVSSDMARIEPLQPQDFPPEMRAALAALRPPNPRHEPMPIKDRPKALKVLGSLAHHPALAQAYFTLNGHLLLATTLTERHRELLVMRVAAVRKCGYEWAQHPCSWPATQG